VPVRRLIKWGVLGGLVAAISRYRKGRLDESDQELGL
jgi:hypothetical protein